MQDLEKYTKKTHLEIPNRYVSTLLIGVIAINGLVFSLGILVGSRQGNRENCPEPDPFAAWDKASAEPPLPRKHEPVPISYYKTLGIAKDPVPTPASLNNTGVKAPRQDAEQNLKTHGLVAPHVTEESILPKLTPGEAGIYSLQVGSFQSRGEASQLVRRLEQAGHTAFLVSVRMEDRGGVWYRVRVGPFETNRDASLYKKEFEDKEQLPAFVVKKKVSG